MLRPSDHPTEEGLILIIHGVLIGLETVESMSMSIPGAFKIAYVERPLELVKRGVLPHTDRCAQ